MKKLFLFRANPDGVNQMDAFLQTNSISIGWTTVPSMEGKGKDEVKICLEKVYAEVSNSSVGQVNHFVNNMKIGDLCLIPRRGSNDVYLAEITKEYYYDGTDKKLCHKVGVEFLNKDNPYNRREFSLELRKALRPPMTIADVSDKLDGLNAFMNNENVKNDVVADVEEELKKLLPKAIENIKVNLESDDPEKRMDASLEVIKLLQELGNNKN
jgi:predicted Mrr-cat superfamily restriction endonuclease